jgi:hypothetical protein
MFNYDSRYKKLANQTLDWLPMDTKKLYNVNLKTRYKDLVANNWIDNYLTYKFNSLGFRCNELSNDPSIMFLGCSYTMGIGLPVETVYPELLSKKLNLKCINLGIGGGSADTAFRMCHGYIDKINPKIVMYMKPPGIRFELVSNNNIENLIVNEFYNNEFYLEFAVDENNSYFNNEKNLLAIKYMCQTRKIKFVHTSCEDLVNSSTSLARDLAHAGVESHYLFTENILQKM